MNTTTDGIAWPAEGYRTTDGTTHPWDSPYIDEDGLVAEDYTWADWFADWAGAQGLTVEEALDLHSDTDEHDDEDE